MDGVGCCDSVCVKAVCVCVLVLVLCGGVHGVWCLCVDQCMLVLVLVVSVAPVIHV